MIENNLIKFVTDLIFITRYVWMHAKETWNWKIKITGNWEVILLHTRMLSVKNKLPAFNNFCSGDLDLKQVTSAKCKENQT